MHACFYNRPKLRIFFDAWTKKKHINSDISFLQKRIKVKFFFAFDNRHSRKDMLVSSWMLVFWEKSLEKRNHSVAKCVVHPNLLNVILPKNVSKCWSLMHVGKKSTNVLASQKLQFATDSQNDVKNWGKWWILMLHQNP